MNGMKLSSSPGREHASHERMIGSLCARTGAPEAEVRALFSSEFARLALGATIRSYLTLLAGANVLGLLSRARRSFRADMGRRRVDTAVERQLPESGQTVQAVGARPSE